MDNLLFYSVFHTFNRKNDSSVVLKSLNPEGPLGSYLCDVTLPTLFITCQFFVWNKENKHDFLLGDKKFKFLYLWSIFCLGGSVGCAIRLETRRSRVQHPPRSATFFLEIDHEIFSTVILSLPLIQEEQLSVSGKRMCTITG